MVVFSQLLAARWIPQASNASEIVYAPAGEQYPDGRPAAHYRLEAQDQGVVLRHGHGPGRCDALGARDVWIYKAGGMYYLHYDGVGPKGWLV